MQKKYYLTNSNCISWSSPERQNQYNARIHYKELTYMLMMTMEADKS